MLAGISECVSGNPTESCRERLILCGIADFTGQGVREARLLTN